MPKKPDGSSPAQLPDDEAARLDALHETGVLDTLPEAAYDDLVFLASTICETPIALVSLVDAERQWFKARVGLSAEQTTRDWAFCSHAILDKEEILEVPDATQDARFATNPLVTSDPSIRFYAGVPLVTPDGFALGTLCAIDRTPRILTATQRRALRAIARQVTTQLELRRNVATLEKALAAARTSGGSSPPGTASIPPGGTIEERVRALLARMQELQRQARR